MQIACLAAHVRITYLLVKAQVPISIFFAGPVGDMSKSKISIGKPSVVHALGNCGEISSAAIDNTAAHGLTKPEVLNLVRGR